jgi:hypothetical protein
MENKKINQSNKEENEKKIKFSWSVDSNKNIDLSKLEYDKPAYNKDSNNYSLITFLSSKRKPDFYINDKVIKAKFYKTKQTKIEEEKEVQDSDEEVKRTEQRYFNHNLTIKCFNCGEVGHMSRNCPHDEIIICTRCNERGHDSFSCFNMKCFKCNKIGHRSFECKFKDVKQCEKCGHNGHIAADCMAKPDSIPNTNLRKCRFCGERDHLICPFPKKMYIIQEYDPDNVVFTDGEEAEVERHRRKDKPCPRCGEGDHLLDRCKVRPPDNSFDKAREQYKKKEDDKYKYRENDRNKYREYESNKYRESINNKYREDDRSKYRKKQYRSDSEESFSNFRQQSNKYKRYDDYKFNYFK